MPRGVARRAIRVAALLVAVGASCTPTSSPPAEEPPDPASAYCTFDAAWQPFLRAWVGDASGLFVRARSGGAVDDLVALSESEAIPELAELERLASAIGPTGQPIVASIGEMRVALEALVADPEGELDAANESARQFDGFIQTTISEVALELDAGSCPG